MTSPKRSLHPAGGDDRGALLGTLELVARGAVKLGEVVEAIVGQGIALESGPQVLHRIEIGLVRRQERDQDMSAQAVQVVAHQATAVRLQAIPDDQQRLLQMGFQRLEEFDDLFLLDAALVQPEQAVGARESGDDRDVTYFPQVGRRICA